MHRFVCVFHFSSVILHTVHTFMPLKNSCNVLYTVMDALKYTILPDAVFQTVELDGEDIPPEFIYIDEARFNLTKVRRRGRNLIGHKAIINVPGQRGCNITLCAAIAENGVIHCHGQIGPYNIRLILVFLNQLHNILTAVNRWFM